MKTLKKMFVVFLVCFIFGAAGQPAFSFEKINLNTATVEQLIQLNGIGPVMAERIIEFRQARAFSSVDDLAQVQGIGEKTLDKLRDQVMVETLRQ